jgi:hypothetical protein
VLTGSGVAACEIAGFGGVGSGLGVSLAVAVGAADAVEIACVEWLRVTCVVAFLAIGTHPASMAMTATEMPIAANPRLHVELVVAAATPRFSLSNMIPPQPNPSRATRPGFAAKRHGVEEL